MAKRIVIVHPNTLATPGGGTVGCVQIARRMAMRGVEITVISTRSGPVTSSAFPFRVITTPPAPGHYLLNGSMIARAVRDLMRNADIDAVLGWGFESAFLPGLLRSKGVLFGMIAAFPSYDAWLNRDTSWRPIKRRVDEWFRWRPLRLADLVFALSDFTRQQITRLFGLDPRRVVTAHWAVDEFFAGIPRTPLTEVSHLMFYGNLGLQKGVFDALDALSRVAFRRDWTLRVAGWGDEKRVRAAAKRCHIADRVTMLGNLDHPSLARELEWAHLAILPSRAESFGLAIAEAQAAGLAVVSYENCAVPEVVEKNRTGWLVPLGSIDGLAAAIDQAISDPVETYRKGLAGRERICHLFSWDRTVTLMLQAIDAAQLRTRGNS